MRALFIASSTATSGIVAVVVVVAVAVAVGVIGAPAVSGAYVTIKTTNTRKQKEKKQRKYNKGNELSFFLALLHTLRFSFFLQLMVPVQATSSVLLCLLRCYCCYRNK